MDHRSVRGHLGAMLAAFALAASGVVAAQSVNRTYSCALGGSPWTGTSTGSFQEACSNAAASSPLVDGPSCTPSSQSVTGTYNGQCALYSSVETTCTNGAVRPSGSGVGSLNCSVSYGCSGGYVFVNGACMPPAGGGGQDDCGQTKGKRPGDDVCAVLNRTGYKMQMNGCVYEMGGEGEYWTIREGPHTGMDMWCGGWIGTGESVGNGSPNVGVSRPAGGAKPGTGDTTDPNRTGQTGGGTSQPNQGFNSTDAANLAKIATNTGTTVKAVDAMNQNLNAKLDAIRSAVESSGGSGGGGGGGGSTVTVPCGGPGQIVCAEDGGPAASATAGLAGGVTQAGQPGVDKVGEQQSALGSPPDFGGNESRWKVSLNSFLGVSPSCTHTWSANLPYLGPQSFTLNVCPWAEYFRDFAYWAFAILTAFGLWSILYSPRSNA